MIYIIIIILALAGCGALHSTSDRRPSVATVRASEGPVKEITADADRARADAIGYIGWKQSKVENIEWLQDLTIAMNHAIDRMKASPSAINIVEARRAVQAVREFLATKGD